MIIIVLAFIIIFYFFQKVLKEYLVFYYCHLNYHQNQYQKNKDLYLFDYFIFIIHSYYYFVQLFEKLAY